MQNGKLCDKACYTETKVPDWTLFVNPIVLPFV